MPGGRSPRQSPRPGRGRKTSPGRSRRSFGFLALRPVRRPASPDRRQKIGCNLYRPSPKTKNTGNRRRAQAMLFTSMSSSPNRTVGRRIACGMPDSTSARSSLAFPLKYSKGESSAGLVILMCTTRPTPAADAAANIVIVFSTAQAWRMTAWLNRTQ